MVKKRVFISFDYDNDQHLKNFMIGQAKSPASPFEIVDFSLKETQPEKEWKEKARKQISYSQLFMVMLGPKTRQCRGVLAEVLMAQELEKRRVQIIGSKDGSRDWRVPGAGTVYRWNWDNIDKILQG